MATFSGPGYVANFDAAALVGKITKGVERGIGLAGAHMVATYKEMLNKPGPKPRRRGAKSGGRRIGQVVKGQTVSVSSPGEPPHYRTRDLINSVMMERLKPDLVRVGTRLKYGLWLELGVPKNHLAPRPWLRPGLVKERDRIAAIIMASAKAG